MAKMVTIGFGRRLSLDDVVAVAHGARVSLSNRTGSILSSRRRQIIKALGEQQTPAYGFNRGFGHNVDNSVPNNKLAELQQNIIRSHSCGMGPALGKKIVRAAMLLRAQSLSLGHSGVRPEVVKALVTFLNRGVTPVVPSYGSVGASGDLIPLSHIALALIGEGEVFVGDSKKPLSTKKALSKLRLKPLTLEMKEGLALNNGVQLSTAIAVLSCRQMQNLLKTAAIATAMSAQVLLASDESFRKDLHELRPHPGAKRVSAWIWRLMQNSPMRESHRAYDLDGEVQDPYSIRCAAQILGSCDELIEQAKRTLEIEINSVTDNPILLSSAKAPGSFTQIVSGGHFHGMPVAVSLYNLIQAMSIMARLSNMRCARFVDEKRNKGLGSDLIHPQLSESDRATSSGMMTAEYASAALTNLIWAASMPNHLFSISTDAGQEDHVSMSAGLAVRVDETLPRLAEVLALELAFATQAYEIRKCSETIPSKISKASSGTKKAEADLMREISKQIDRRRFEPAVNTHLLLKWTKSQRKLSPICEIIAKNIGRVMPPIKRDRELSREMQELARLVSSGKLLAPAKRLWL